jgi:hypothetical protein
MSKNSEKEPIPERKPIPESQKPETDPEWWDWDDEAKPSIHVEEPPEKE